VIATELAGRVVHGTAIFFNEDGTHCDGKKKLSDLLFIARIRNAKSFDELMCSDGKCKCSSILERHPELNPDEPGYKK
jgi:hypothetical protein